MHRLDKRTIPSKPGVYLFKNKAGEVIYVGKAKNLFKRVTQYFQSTRTQEPRTSALVNEVHHIDTIVTTTETEALMLENTLIKKELPKYNISLKDDKQYSYVKITKEDFPRIFVVHQTERDGSLYLGPHSSADRTRWLVRNLRRAFPFCLAPRDSRFGTRACLYVHLGLCSGPCMSMVSQVEYQKNIAHIVRFLRGAGESTVKQLRSRMKMAARARHFEEAARLRDAVRSLEIFFSQQQVVSARRDRVDVFALARAKDVGIMTVLSVRDGKLSDRDTVIMNRIQDMSDDEIFSRAIVNRYSKEDDIPKYIVVPELPLDSASLTLWLHERALELKIPLPRIHAAKRGRMAHLVRLANANASEDLRRILREKGGMASALADLQSALSLSELPHRIEAYDLSNIQGVHATGSLVVLEDGKPKKSDYRRFRIKTVKGANDVAMMEEVLTRRLKYLAPSHKTRNSQLAFVPSSGRGEIRNSWVTMPALLLLDGGKPQLGAGLRALKRYNLNIPIAALAKREEELFVPGKRTSIRLPRNSEALHIVMRIRDEAHRFARAYYQKLHRKTLTIDKT